MSAPLCPVCGSEVYLENSAPNWTPLAECPDCGWSNGRTS